MRARPGDWLMIKGALVGSPDELGFIMEVRGADGTPPYLVRWLRTDREGLVFPGADSVVLTAQEKAAADERERRRIEAMQQAIRESGRHHRGHGLRTTAAA